MLRDTLSAVERRRSQRTMAKNTVRFRAKVFVGFSSVLIKIDGVIISILLYRLAFNRVRLGEITMTPAAVFIGVVQH